MSQREYTEEGIRRVMIAALIQATRDMQSQEKTPSFRAQSYKAGAWLETTGVIWMDVLDIGVNRQKLVALVKQHRERQDAITRAELEREAAEKAAKAARYWIGAET